MGAWGALKEAGPSSGNLLKAECKCGMESEQSFEIFLQVLLGAAKRGHSRSWAGAHRQQVLVLGSPPVIVPKDRRGDPWRNSVVA